MQPTFNATAWTGDVPAQIEARKTPLRAIKQAANAIAEPVRNEIERQSVYEIAEIRSFQPGKTEKTKDDMSWNEILNGIETEDIGLSDLAGQLRGKEADTAFKYHADVEMIIQSMTGQQFRAPVQVPITAEEYNQYMAIMEAQRAEELSNADSVMTADSETSIVDFAKRARITDKIGVYGDHIEITVNDNQFFRGTALEDSAIQAGSIKTRYIGPQDIEPGSTAEADLSQNYG